MQALEAIFSMLVPFVTPETGEYWQTIGLLTTWGGLALLIIVLLSQKVKVWKK